uniref:Periviscerokinin-1 n=2 Tax=Derocalymma TaxID=344691 RepID=PVK1_DERCR|nr:RecName: Full=Periviscerokinin-1; Short=DerVe-PVK-1 [Derocalymma versicolor]P85580.1 RecName: Full=Periviscerokinin-1; Short=DerCr-PVK-1 [Derocalymma cruralis]
GSSGGLITFGRT